MTRTYSVDSFPIEDQKHQASQLQKRGGGNVRNLLEVFQQLPQDEVPLTLLAALPAEDSWETKFIQESVTNVGFLGSSVDFSHAFYRESVQNAPSSFQIRNAAAGTRTGVRYNGVEDMSLEEFKEAADRISNEIRLYHFEVCSQTRRPLGLAKTIEGEKHRRHVEVHTLLTRNVSEDQD